ncbi:MAG TPA: transporter substrate-binding domain-containing protein [Noviherbaspirillum sp.]|nr:transporter substrate-binding domain-containing protein [Noviherbaspirillum sp.]
MFKNAFAPLCIHSAQRLLLVAAMVCAGASAIADSGLERAKKRSKLIAGVDYVVPEYKGGMKFRTPETIDVALAQDLARRMRLPLAAARNNNDSSGKADVMLKAIPEADISRASEGIIPVGYSAGPMAIMRTDTDIKSWEQLKGRTVCLAEGGRYVGMLAAKYGAIEKVQKAPADSLLALRIGSCDAAVHDSAMLEELLKLPEWKKFSARLPAGPRSTLAFVVPAGDRKSAAILKSVASEWSNAGYPGQLTKKAVQNIAFEVYLDQNVPDCH